MSRLNELIKELCPNGVEFMKIRDIGQVKMCKRIMKSETNNKGGVPFYKIGTFGKETDSFISAETFNKYKEQYSYPKKGDILISCSGTIGRIVIFDGKPSYFQDSNIVWLEHDGTKVRNEYLKHIYSTKPWKVSTGGTIARLYNDNILDTKIAVPPLEVQDEIIHILDDLLYDFTLLSSELSVELKARQKQYEYYRNYLIKETNKIECKNLTLEDILKIKNGKDYKHLGEGKYPVYGTGGIITYVDEFIYDRPSVLIPRKGSLDKLYYIEEPFWNVDTIFYTEINENEVIPKYLYYYLQNEHLERLNIAGGIPSLTQSTLKKVKITIPNKDIQKRIINVLDNFDKICLDFHIGLPAEIELRQKQYEYYRDKLLTFKELKVKNL